MKEREVHPLVPPRVLAATTAATTASRTSPSLGRADPTTRVLDLSTRAPDLAAWELGWWPRPSLPSPSSPRAGNMPGRREEAYHHPMR